MGPHSGRCGDCGRGHQFGLGEAQAPVFVVYRTVVTAPDDHVTFRQDVYGWDARIAAALAGR
jgi:hypothetical protein